LLKCLFLALGFLHLDSFDRANIRFFGIIRFIRLPTFSIWIDLAMRIFTTTGDQ
jgi:hypothetical protein